MTHNQIENYIKKIKQATDLSEKEAFHLTAYLLAGTWQDDNVEALLTAWRDKGETAGELAGAAKALRQLLPPFSSPDLATDCCGTGGDGLHTYNISTAVAFVAAACGIPMAKHGNRAASSLCGAADVLEELGVQMILSPAALAEALKLHNFCFLYAPQHHAALKKLAPVRKKIKGRTIFNLLGPLANPAHTKYQLMGVFDPKWLKPMAQTLKNLGSKKALVVCAENGMDEISLSVPTNAILYNSQEMKTLHFTAKDFDLPEHKEDAIRGGDAQTNAQALLNVLHGNGSAYRDTVVANCAAILWMHEHAESLKECAEIAQRAIDTKKALQIFENYKEFSIRHSIER